ncbi:MAG: DUF5924 family protein [Acidobacteriota bacterium]
MSDKGVSWRGKLRVRTRHLAARAQDLHSRYARIFWMAHSAWALVTGAAVLVLAHNRYGFLPWVVLFLALTWASTLVISRFASFFQTPAMSFARGFVSYITRVMYQETLFFLLPFYFYSTTVPSWNAVFVLFLAALAALSCFDLLFDRLLREKRAFALGFFGVVTFSSLQFFLPLLLHMRVHVAAYLAAIVAFMASVPLAYGWRDLRQWRLLLKLTAVLILVVLALKVVRPAVPPVPLRLAKLRFAAQFDARTLRATEEFTDRIPLAKLADGRLYAIATIFSPTRLPTSIVLTFKHEGIPERSSRTLDLVAHERGFRVWGVLRAPKDGFTPGLYVIDVTTAEGQLVGRGEVRVASDHS